MAINDRVLHEQTQKKVPFQAPSLLKFLVQSKFRKALEYHFRIQIPLVKGE